MSVKIGAVLCYSYCHSLRQGLAPGSFCYISGYLSIVFLNSHDNGLPFFKYPNGNATRWFLACSTGAFQSCTLCANFKDRFSCKFFFVILTDGT